MQRNYQSSLTPPPAKKAKVGSVKEELEKGHFYYEHNNEEKALGCYQEAIRLGLPPSELTLLGDRFINSDDKRACLLYRAASTGENPDPKALYRLGQFYMNGWGVLKNNDEAFKLLKNAYTKGCGEATVLLYLCYDDGIGVAADSKRAIAVLNEGVAKGIADAQYMASERLIERGRVNEAIALANKAIDQGNELAIRAYAEYYEYGSAGIPQNKIKAKELRARLQPKRLDYLEGLALVATIGGCLDNCEQSISSTASTVKALSKGGKPKDVKKSVFKDDKEELEQQKSPLELEEQLTVAEKNNEKLIQKELEQQQKIFKQSQCPLSLVIMRDPFVASDGYTYERSMLLEHLKVSNESPCTRQKLIDRVEEISSIRDFAGAKDIRGFIHDLILENREAAEEFYQVYPDAIQNPNVSLDEVDFAKQFKKLYPDLVEPKQKATLPEVQEKDKFGEKLHGQEKIVELEEKIRIANENNTRLLQKELKQQEAMLKKAICPLSNAIMRDPYVAQNGHTYEKASFLEDLNDYAKSTSPSEQKLKAIMARVVPSAGSKDIRDAIHNLILKNPQAAEQFYLTHPEAIKNPRIELNEVDFAEQFKKLYPELLQKNQSRFRF